MPMAPRHDQPDPEAGEHSPWPSHPGHRERDARRPVADRRASRRGPPATELSIVCVPRTNPRHGNMIFDDADFEAAQVRIDLAREDLRKKGIDAVGEVGDPDPYSATMDASPSTARRVLISTFPAASSGWLRRDLIERIADAAGIPVDHVVVDLDEEGLPFGVTLAVANRTAASDALLEKPRRRPTDEATCSSSSCPSRAATACAARARPRAAHADDRPRPRRRPDLRGHDRRPRPVHGDHERAAVLPRERRRDLHAARDALGLAARRPRSTASRARRTSPSSTSTAKASDSETAAA